VNWFAKIKIYSFFPLAKSGSCKYLLVQLRGCGTFVHFGTQLIGFNPFLNFFDGTQYFSWDDNSCSFGIFFAKSYQYLDHNLTSARQLTPESTRVCTTESTALSLVLRRDFCVVVNPNLFLINLPDKQIPVANIQILTARVKLSNSHIQTTAVRLRKKLFNFPSSKMQDRSVYLIF
jgi:hypothetical protein